ncbi:DUF6266 family protein [Zhouia spongiae]|uniref:DUF6266 family protein n=1 Tax=Zhouia spongiae TaxID=2202721 RepID=A0ABY3YPV3_9FLAO|nr:DUF6266 family protein [Zhouia spongiae]UNY99870.1 DUF6266 family protein [Zhouia spongiae]
MAVITKGILGGISGKVGTVVGASWKGIDYIRSKPSSVANPRTEGQVNQRNKFSVTLEYLQPNLGFIKLGYKGYAVQKTAFNAAMSYVLNNAITGAAPDFEIDYNLALLSRGSLSGALNPDTDLSTPGQVTFTWDDNSDEGNANVTDKAMLLVYNPSKKASVAILGGQDRTVGSEVVPIPATYAGDTVELFMAFITADNTQVSNSVYLGSGTAA